MENRIVMTSSIKGYFNGLGGHFTWGSECNHGVTEALLDSCAVISRHLECRYVGKSYGGYSIYEDDKILISLDTYVPNIHVSVKLPDGKKETVLFYNFNGFAQEYRRGRWEEYLLDTVLPRALEVKKAKDEERAAAEKARHDADFGPIDDSALFAD